jgi:type II secretory pathway pseudopilin PulG
VVVVVITLLVGSLLVPLATQVEQRNVADTQKRLDDVKEALIGYAMAHGRFPCPASVSSPTPLPTDRGVEDPPNTGICAHPFDGYVPGITLGLANVDSQGFVVDAWGLQQNRIRYAITTSLTNAFTTPNGMRTASITSLGSSSNNFLYVCASSTGITATTCGTATSLSSGDAVFIVYSLGKNAATTGGVSADELANLNTDRVFVSKIASQTGTEFDDLLVWVSRYSVINRLVSAGQLP